MRTWHIGGFTLKYSSSQPIGVAPPNPAEERIARVFVAASPRITVPGISSTVNVAKVPFRVKVKV